MINKIIEQIKTIPGVLTAFQVDDRIVVDLEAGGIDTPKYDMEYKYTGEGATTGLRSPSLTIGKSYKIIGTREKPEWSNHTISIRDDRGVKKWYSPLFMERSFIKVRMFVGWNNNSNFK